MGRINPAVRVAFGLVLLTVSIIMMADFFRLVPDTKKGLLEGRKMFSETLAVQVSLAAGAGDAKLIEETINTVVERNSEITSAALRLSDGEILLRVGDHPMSRGLTEKSTANFVKVPIYRDDQSWGNIEIAFTPIDGAKFTDYISRSVYGLLLFVCTSGFVLYWYFIKRVVRELDPGSVIPERVKSAFNALAEGLLLLDEKEQIILANQAFAEKVGRDPDSLLGHDASKFEWEVKSEKGISTEFPWQRTLKNLERQIGATMVLSGNGSAERTFMVNAVPITNSAGAARGVLVTFDDMTNLEKKHTELVATLDKLRKSEEDLRDKTLELEYLATRDPLTGCLNRRAFLEKFDAAFFTAHETGVQLVCLMIDIDHFKQVNDRYGHTTGDKVIQLVAQLLRTNARPDDLVGRYGGEEFCVILPNTDLETGVEIAERFRSLLREESPKSFSTQHRVTASFGVAMLTKRIDHPTDLVKQADKALYEAKESGRDRVCCWSENKERASATSAGNVIALPRTKQSNDTNPDTPPQRQFVTTEGPPTGPPRLKGDGIDNLTGLPNRVLFIDRIEQALVRDQRHDRITGVISLDIDAFKRVNDALGNVVGDQLLRKVAQRIIAVLRAEDTVAYLGESATPSTVSRLNADEFGILLSDLPSPEPIVWVAKRIFDHLSEKIIVDGHELFATCCAGISLSPQDGSNAQTLIQNASAARNDAKHKLGRNNLQFFSAVVNRKAYRQLWLEGQLHSAFEKRELAVFYQPKLDLASGAICGIEALLRWRHPTMGMVPPVEFIPVAERTGLINEIGAWVLETACKQTREWIEQGHSEITISVNLSNVQFRQDDLPRQINSILQRTGLPPERLELEITESIIMDSYAATSDTIHTMHESGIRFAIDDFGTGYSSLSSLKNLPVDSIKIDRSFLGDSFPDEQDRLIIKAVSSMAHGLGLRVVAEGVETDAQVRFLRELHCDEIQGFLVSRPLSADSSSRFLNAHGKDSSFAASN